MEFVNHPYTEIVWQAWVNQTVFAMPYYADSIAPFRVKALDYSYDIAHLICTDGTYEDSEQFVSLSMLQCLLEGKTIDHQQIFLYANRWFDDDGVPHYHGIYSSHSTIEEAQANTQFNVLDIPVDLVYQALDIDDLYTYLHDVNENADSENDPE
jgi:hypothetical protein